jgi:alkylhydroperoxidase/carboxymuconolactone decarboxylase family protein YurZ
MWPAERRSAAHGVPKGDGLVTTRIPEVYDEFTQEFPEIAAAFEGLAATTHEAGPLDQRGRRLVKLGVSIGAESPGAVRSQVRKALDEGFSRAEIEHAILLSTTTVGLPPMIAALKWSRLVPD